MFLRKHLLVILLSLSAQIFCFAQMEVTSGALPPYDPQTLIEDVLLGEGVEILNIQYDGPDRAVGYFNSATTNIGLEEGIVLTTGVAASEGANVGVVETGNMEASANNQSTASDPDIELLAEGEDIFNLTKYTITFVPSSDKLSFRYVFASEEYPEFGCTPYNDFFGFFISGPGFSGTYENGGENIALIPGTNQAVAINNIHPQNPLNPACTPVFTEFFNDNNGTNNFPVYDGYLDIFTAEADVIPCETYTIKLVIADISDAQRDSGVFFEAKSFNSKGFQVSANSQALDGTLIEGCTDGSFNITIEDPEATDLMIDYQMVGDAVNGVDYETISGSISIPAGQTSVSIPVIPIEDTNIENVESIGLDIQINNCTRDTFFLYLRDPELETPDLGEDLVICANESIDLDGTISASSENGDSFSSSSAPVVILGPIGSNPPTPAFMDIEVSGFYPPQLRAGLINQVCINFGHSAPEDLDIYLYAPGGQFMLLSSDNGSGGSDYTNTCFSPSASNSIINGTAPFTGTFAAEGNWEPLWFGDSPVNGTWRLMAIDDESGFTGAIQSWSIEFNSTFEVNYSWSPTDNLTCSDCPTPTASPANTTEYTLTVSDSYGCETSDNVTITVIDSYDAPVINCTNISTNALTFTWDPIDNADSYEVNVNNDGWFPLNNPPTSHTVNGLSTGEMVSIEVRATGSCPASIGAQTCQTIDCSGLSAMQNSTPTSCNGEADGTISVSANSANSGITYTLNSTSETNATGSFSGLTAGMYTVVVADDAGCSESIMIEITEPAALTSAIALNNNIDCDNDTGSATATGAGGDDSFNYVWSNGDTGATLTALTADEYYVTITDGNMCQMIDSIDIISEGSLEASISSNVICAGTSNGEAVVTVTIGTEPIEYQWDSNASNQMTATATGLMPGEYFVTITSADDCELILSTTITTNPEMTLSPSTTDANCGSEDGTASVSVMGGTADFEYVWSTDPPQMTPTATGLAAGEYFVTVTDANLCTEVTSAIVNTPSGTTLVSLDVTDVSCFGGFDGMVVIEATGGTPPLSYTYDGSGPQTVGEFGAISAGDHVIIVTDDMGCSTSFPFTVNQPNEIETTPISISEIECDSPNGTATVSIVGGDAPYSFVWSDMSTDSILSVSTEGEYYVTITDVNNCMTMDTVMITTGEILSVSTGSTLTCADDTNGTAFVEILTGTAPFTFSWADGSDNDTLYNAAAGDYMVTVSDANNCEVIETITIGAFPEMILSTSITEAGCGGIPDGTATVTVMGGTADFTYAWDDAMGQTTATATGLAAGEYFVTVTDANLCTSVISAVVTTPSSINLLSLITNDASCFGEEDGTLSAMADGGTPPLSYTVGMNPAQATGDFAGLAAGDYNLVVTDAMGCSSSYPFMISSPTEIETTPINIQTIDCQNPMGSATVSVTGGSLPYSFLWSNMQTDSILSTNMTGEYYVTLTDNSGCTTMDTVQINEADVLSMNVGSMPTCNGEMTGFAFAEVSTGTAPFVYQWDANAGNATTDTVFNLAPGMYTVTVTDAGNCELIQTITIDEFPAMLLSTSTTDADCNGAPDGTATVTVMGGTADFTYLWSDANGQTTATATALSAGLYTVTVTDTNGCTMTADANVSTPSMLSIGDISATGVTCFDGMDGTATVTATGGTGDFTFTWNDATMQNTATAINLSPAEYTVTVSDEAGCQVTASVEVENAEEIILDFATVDVLCASDMDGSIDLTILSGGSPAFTYEWSNMAVSEDLNSLSAGIYSVIVTDANMCTATGEATINTTAPITVTPTSTDATCYNYEDGSISIDVTGGVEPYSYAWSTGDTSDDLSNIAAGTYELTVTDANNCGVFSAVEIAQPDVFTASIETIEPLCAGDETGTLTITPIGGQADYQYSLDGINYTENPVFDNIAAQNYHVFVQDGNDCLFDSTNVLVSEPQELRVELGEDITTEIGERAFLEALIAGGTGAVDFSWETPEDISLSCEDCFAPFALSNNSGNVIVTVIDENDCMATDDIFITVKKSYDLFIPNVFTPDLDGNNDVFMPFGKSNTLIKSMQIYDRWGDIVYSGGDFFVNGDIGWDGKVKGSFVETGVYVYAIEAIFVDGESVLFKGDVTVLR